MPLTLLMQEPRDGMSTKVHGTTCATRGTTRKSTLFQSKSRSPSTQRTTRGQRALGGPPSACTWVWFHLETNMPKCRRANSVVLITEPSGKHVSEGDGVKEAPWSNLRHGGKLRGAKTYHRTRWRCVHAQDWCNVRNHSSVPLLCALCPVLSCSLCAALSNPQQRTMSSVAFYPNRQ